MKNNSFLERPVFTSVSWFTWEILFFGLIIALAFLTRFLLLGERAMSHDESLHTFYSWQYANGLGYQHNPMMHGPLQFHLLAATYFFLGATDFTSRIPAALFNIATIWMVWYWRRYLGNLGALIAALLFLFSPYFLFYGRYARNEAFVGLFAIVMLYSILRYFETGRYRYLYLITLTVILHLITKETSYIYIALVLIFLAGYLIVRITSRAWDNVRSFRGFIIALVFGVFLIGMMLIAIMLTNSQQPAVPATVQPAVPSLENPTASSPYSSSPIAFLAIAGIIAVGFSLYFLLQGYGLKRLRTEKSFDILMLVGTLTLPTLSAPITMLFGGNPMDYSSSGIARSAMVIVPLVIISMVLGLWWNKKVWAISAFAFWGIFVIFYTSLFTNGSGFYSGLIGSLGYWLEQQPVERGSQPLYYYILIQIPFYEFLPAVGALIGLYYGFRHKPGTEPALNGDPREMNYSNTFALLTFWSAGTLIAFTVAGERMPWLTYHITLSLMLLAGMGIGQLIERIDWHGLRQRCPFISVVLVLTFLINAAVLLYILLGAQPPFQGKDLKSLQSTGMFLIAAVGLLASGFGIWYLLKDWHRSNILRLGTLSFLGILFGLTISTSLRANFINYGNGKEYLVYAHGASGIKEIFKQITELSFRTTGSPTDIQVAYDDDTAWPLTWYLRDFPNQRYYGAQPSMDLSSVPVIIVGDNNYAAIEPVVRDGFYRQDFIRMVWPNMDYFNLSLERIRDALTDKNIRGGIMNIWLFRDYLPYANALTQKYPNISINGYTTAEWGLADRMRLYIRKDIAGQVWEYGSSPVTEIPPDPYEGNKIDLTANQAIGSSGMEAGQFNAPRGLATAPDGSIYVADSRNNRIQHFSSDGSLINTWGSYADVSLGDAPMGTFNEPWGVAVAKDGTVFVSDTWNHRIQKFSSGGKPIKEWGVFGQSTDQYGFYGPRGLSISPDGYLYVADTGNNRVVIYDLDGNYKSEFGTPGIEPGQFSEPVDVFVDTEGRVYVTDTWNQRIQVFQPADDLSTFDVIANWSVAGWYSGSNENKPFIAVDERGHIFVTDPEGYRIIEFGGLGEDFIKTWGSFGTDLNQLNLPTGLAVDRIGNLWVSDSGNNRLLEFTSP